MPPRISESYGTMPSSYTSPSIDDADDDDDDDNVLNNPYALKRTDSKYRYYVQIDDAVERIGIGKFQYSILFAAGLCFMADAMEVLLLSFLSIVLKHEWNLTDNEMNSIFSIVFAGALFGTLILGPAGDYWGRKPIFILTALIIAISGVITAFCTNYIQLVIARFFCGFGIGGLTVPFDTLGEFLPTSSRGKNLLYIEFFWTFGTLSVPLLAYFTLDTTNGGDDNGESHWQLFVILCSVPCFISTALGIILVPESPRWLLESSTTSSHLVDDETGSNKAITILKYAALKNGISQKVIDEELFPPGTRLITSWKDVSSIQLNQSLTQHSHSHSHDESMVAHTLDNTSNEGGSGGFKELFNSPSRTRLTLLLWSTWFGLGFLYYGVILAVSIVFTNEEEMEDDEANGNGNGGSYAFDYEAIFISASSEIFGLIIVLFTIDKFGRIPSQTISYRVGGTATLLMGILYHIFYNNNDEDDITYLHRYVLIGLAFIARMAMMGATSTTWVSTSEILTTDIRSTGHGSANAMARLGGFISPYIITQGNSLLLIGIIVSIVSLFTAEFASRLPETTGKSMGDISNNSPPSPSNSNTNDNKKTGLMMDDENDDDNNNSEIISVASSTPSTAKRKGLSRIETMEVTTPSIDEEDDTTNSAVAQPILPPPSAVASARRNNGNPSTATMATESATSYHELL